jgi:hypothetical protein
MKSNTKGLLNRALVFVAVISAASGTPSYAVQSMDSNSLEESVQIKANCEDVLSAIRAYRNSPVDHRRLISCKGSTAVVDEEVTQAPVVGHVHNVWQEDEHGTNRIDYHLVESDKFKSGSGTYLIDQPNHCGPVTLTLRSLLDTGVHFPGCALIARGYFRKDLRQRLSYIKQLAESSNKAPAITSNQK